MPRRARWKGWGGAGGWVWHPPAKSEAQMNAGGSNPRNGSEGPEAKLGPERAQNHAPGDVSGRLEILEYFRGGVAYMTILVILRAKSSPNVTYAVLWELFGVKQ